MVRLFVVDDEMDIRKNVIKKINWGENDIQVCGEASNGKEAIELIEDAAPDILIADIRMPIMDGLAMTEHLLNFKPNIKIIILSGYDDFGYAQRALKFGAFDYLLKPCKAQEILDAVIKAKLAIENEKKRENLLLSAKLQLNEAIPLAKENFLAQLIHKEFFDLDYISERFNKLGIALNPNNVIASVIHIFNLSDCFKNSLGDSFSQTKYEIKNIISKTISSCCICEVFEDLDDIIVILNEPNTVRLLPIMNTLNEKLREYLHTDISIGVGRNYGDITNINLSFNEAKEAVKAGFFFGSNLVICFDDIENIYKSGISYPIQAEKNLLECLGLNNSEEDLKMYFVDFFSSLNVGNIPKDYIIKASISLLLSVYKHCVERNIDTDSIFGPGLSYLDEIYSLNNIDQLKAKIWNMLSNISKELSSKKSTNKVITMATKYIKENYKNDISLESIAHNVYVTPSYLSMLFKSTLGINFVGYLNKIRIEKACELLKDMRYKTYEIAEIVGYKDEKYFSFVFKKVTGLPPSQYRNNVMISSDNN